MFLLDAIPPVHRRVGHLRHKPDSLLADRGYDHDIYRDQVRTRGIVPAFARRSTWHGTQVATACQLDGDRLYAWSRVVAPMAAIANLATGGPEAALDELLAPSRR